MYKVVETEKMKTKKYSVTVKNEDFLENYEISEDIMVEFRLVKNKELDEETFKKFVLASKRDKEYQKVLHYALYKMRCIKDISEYLNKLDIPVEEHDYYIERLKKIRILDDNRYSEVFIKENFEFKKIGPNKLIQELNQKCIDKSIYEKHIYNINENQIKENIEYLFNKKLDSIKGKTKIVVKQNIKQFITNKGYDYDIVSSYVDSLESKIIERVNESEILKKDFQHALKKYAKKTVLNKVFLPIY